MKRLDQKGFGATVLLLIIVVVAAIGLTGYLVWHSRQSVVTSVSAAAQPHYLVVKEWGVKAPYNGPLTLEYNMNAAHMIAYFTSRQLASSQDPGCGIGVSSDGAGGTLHNAGGGEILRFAAADDVSDALLGPGSAALSAEQAYEDAAYKGTIVKVGSYYYVPAGVQGSCDDTTGTVEQTVAAVKALLAKLQVIPQ